MSMKTVEEIEQIHRDDLAQTVKATPKVKRGGDRMAKIRSVMTDGAKRMEGMLLDSFTASMLCQVHDALSPENQKDFASRPLAEMARIGWKLAEKSKSKLDRIGMAELEIGNDNLRKLVRHYERKFPKVLEQLSIAEFGVHDGFEMATKCFELAKNEGFYTIVKSDTGWLFFKGNAEEAAISLEDCFHECYMAPPDRL